MSWLLSSKNSGVVSDVVLTDLKSKLLKRESLGVRQDNSSSASEPKWKGRLISLLQMLSLVERRQVFEHLKKPLGEDLDENEVTPGKQKIWRSIKRTWKKDI